MRVLVFGRTGQVAHELERRRWPSGVSLTQLGRDRCDLRRPEEVRDAITEVAPDVVVNAAAYTAVDRAESDEALARQINAAAPATMAQACERQGSVLIHLSTDYVFDGAKQTPYLENDPVGPLSVYGISKAAGERAIRDATERHVILRTTWVFASHGTNFVRTMLRLADRQSEIRVVRDQHGAPTAARDVAAAIGVVLDAVREDRRFWGTFHFTSSEPTSWYDFARAIFQATRRVVTVSPIVTADYPTAARRPLNSVLDCGLIRSVYGIPQPSWRLGLSQVLAELGEAA